MSAIKGIIVSISIITALSVAVLENPQIQVWLEEQRRKIQELLRSIGEELDPQSRRAAEAFAFEGQTVINDAGIRREATASQQAAAVATGRSLDGGSTIYRIPVKGPVDPDEAEERRRKGREYLANRNREMLEMRQKRSKDAVANGQEKVNDKETPQSPTFDAFVDEEGKLKPAGPELPSPPMDEPIAADVMAEMREVERNLAQPMLAAGESSSSSAWDVGSRYANPFGDEYALERSITPKPLVPPKIALETLDPIPDDPDVSVPGSWTAQPEEEHVDRDALSYEEQLAIAMSLSEQESYSATSATVRQSQPEEEADMAAAIAASLRDMDVQQATHAVEHSSPLVDLTPSTPVMTPRRSDWDALLDSQLTTKEQPVLSPSTTGSEDLYGATPELTKARLANFNASQSGPSQLPFDPVRDAARTCEPQQASFHSAFAQVTPTPTLDHETQEGHDQPRSGAQTPTHTASSFGFRSDDSDDFESAVSISTASRAQSPPRSEISGIEVVDLLDDSDVDMLSEEGDGIVTPDWSEFGSQEADSEMDDEEATRL